MEEPKKTLNLKGGELVDHPGWYKINGRVEDSPDAFSMVRKPDGTWWWIAGEHYFPPEGGNMRIDLGEGITKPEISLSVRNTTRSYFGSWTNSGRKVGPGSLR